MSIRLQFLMMEELISYIENHSQVGHCFENAVPHTNIFDLLR